MLIESERCDNCGKTYDAVYSVDDATWDRFAGLNICLCPTCADKLARGNGLFPYWEMRHGEYPTQALKTENARLKEALRECVDFLVSIEHGTALPVGSSFDHSPRYCPVCQFSGVGIRKHLDGCELEKNLTKAREVLGEVPSP